MNDPTLAALQDSIAHWERMRDDRAETPEQPIAPDCALCRLFYTSRPSPTCCYGCPVYTTTSQQFCRGTPYAEAERAYDDPNEFAWKEAAQAEIDFLKSLLPEPAQ